MKIKTELMRKVEKYIVSSPWDEEAGGFLLESDRTHVVMDFLPIPNIAPSPQTTYRFPENALKTARRYSNSKRMTVVADWHSHPDPCIMSTADLSYARANDDLFMVTISPTSKYHSRDCQYLWYACKGVKPERIEEV